MARLHQMRAQTVGLRKDDALELPSGNHVKKASLSPSIEKQAASQGLRRAAGNIFICNSSKDIWAARAGKLVRLTSVEVDHGESVAGADASDPGSFLQDALDDLTF